jgi:uncharacterized membrane protein
LWASAVLVILSLGMVATGYLLLFTMISGVGGIGLIMIAVGLILLIVTIVQIRSSRARFRGSDA